MKFPESLTNETNCLHFPSHISWQNFTTRLDESSLWFDNSTDSFQFQLVLFCTLSGFLHFFLKRLGVPRFTCQVLTGLIFGCSWKQWDDWKFRLFSDDSEAAMGLYSSFGYALFLFLSALKVSPKMIAKTERKSLLIGIPTLVAPVISGIVLQAIFEKGLTQHELNIMPLLLSFHAKTSFPDISALLHDLNMVNSKLGRLGLSSALISDILSLALLNIGGSVKRFKEAPSEAAFELTALIMLLSLIFLVFRPLILWMVKQTPEGEPVQRNYVQAVIFMVFACIVLANLTGKSALTGVYVLGLVCPDGDPLASTFVNRIEWLVLDVFLPIMVTTCVLRIDLSQFSFGFDSQFTRLNFFLICVIAMIKMMSCFLSSLYCKLPVKEALTLSIIFCCKGIVQLSLYQMAADNHYINDHFYTYMVFVIFVFATIVPNAVRFLYDPSSKYIGHTNRNILHLKPNSELRVLACVHRDTDVYNTVHLLNISCPKEDNPMAVFVFHLIEQIGRTTPIFISHSLPENNMNNRSHSENMLISFENFEKDNHGTVSIECFTTISPNKFIHDNICSMALDKTTSLVLLPFHQTWTIDGLVMEDDAVIRTLNCNVLEKAPCSVGIFADRGNLARVTVMVAVENRYTYSVCVIFLGGDDDREAVAYAKRMAYDTRVELTVVRLQSPGEDDSSDWESILDSQLLRDFKLNCVGDGRKTYIEEDSKDGPQTALRIRKMINAYDLMIVGRRHGLKSPQTTGLGEWNEYPELGIIGDLIISTDTNIRTSVLVIQKQMVKHS